ncbi:MAG: class I SAM-dependent methyltransferase [Phycisphaerales bacterium]|nr:class I SAM-dependent methyltransferase [Phycisphaerales bacterium]MCI0631668.1 class I SAM-dependent methyltransferase [Phycisphaerales bacterium]MCI0677034.1 class I SAM-dependent methyltransferase [Phycisphaerales bacterium]
MDNQPAIVVSADSADPTVQRAARELAEELELPVEAALAPLRQSISSPIHAFALALVMTDDRLELRDLASRSDKGLFADLASLHRAGSRARLSRKQPLGRAIGAKAETVLDATAGLGHDSMLLALMGYRVVAVERSAVLFALLRDGLRRALHDPTLKPKLQDHLQIVHGDARDILRAGRMHPDAIYIDPMFPPKRKASALAKKGVRMIRQMVGDDPDAADLVNLARQHAKRVVVKRPNHAGPLAGKPSINYAGKLVRYDVYIQT